MGGGTAAQDRRIHPETQIFQFLLLRHFDALTFLHERLRWGYPRTSILSCVLFSKSLASCRSRNCPSGGPLSPLTIRPPLTSARSPVSFVQRGRSVSSCVCTNL